MTFSITEHQRQLLELSLDFTLPYVDKNRPDLSTELWKLYFTVRHKPDPDVEVKKSEVRYRRCMDAA
jgi:hypothetical protein